jgi:hypothetical protein
VRDGQTSPRRPRLVVSRGTCPPLCPPPPANRFVIGTVVINTHQSVLCVEEEEEEEEDVFVFNDAIEGPRAPAIKPGRVVGDRGALHCRWNVIATQPLGLVSFQARGILPVAEEQRRTRVSQSGGVEDQPQCRGL